MSVLPIDSFSVSIATTTSSTSTDLPIFKEYAWDFINNDFIIKDGKLVILEKNEALKIWIYKAFKTPRFRYLAYSFYYGNNFESLIGKASNSDSVKVELKSLLEQCLLVNKYIKSIDSVDVELQDNKLIGTVNLTTVYSSMETEVDVDV